MSSVLDVKYDGIKSYEIAIESSFNSFSSYFERIGKTYSNVCIITDSGVEKFYLNKLKNIFQFEIGIKSLEYVFLQGENSKNLETVQKIYEFLIVNNFTRNDLLVALGGGVTGDITGFCAATYLRGIDFIQIPTSLLAQVDSSVGGKTGVDFMSYKNMVGAFYMPKMVYCSMDAFSTLDDRQFVSGLGEVIKYAYCFDKDFLNYLVNNRELIIKRNKVCMEYIVKNSLEYKRKVVEIDPKERGPRALLNFGHTIGHAVEKLKHFELLHGECVSIGIAASAYISFNRGFISQEEYNDILNTLISFNLPVKVSGLTADEITQATYSDKKRTNSGIKFILLRKIGEGYIDDSLSDNDISEAAKSIIC
jgi:3-dehydroquinate synthase